MATRAVSVRPNRSAISRGRAYELLWDGKYDARGLRHGVNFNPQGLALHPLERHSAQGSAPGIPSGWVNRLVLGDNHDAMRCLLPSLHGAVQLIYLDPPFGSGADYLMGNGSARAGRAGDASRVVAYRDRWSMGSGSYLSFMAERLALMRELLTESGTLFLHCDWHSHAPLRLLLDEIFGADRFVNEIVWHYFNKFARGRHCLPRAHDSILLYSRGRMPALYPLRFKRDEPRRQLVRKSVNGVLRNARDAEGKLMYRIVHDKKADDVWTIPQLQPASSEWTGYATQKHPMLLERILALASRPGDLVADFFCGSGTTLMVAQRMGRRFVGCDLGSAAVHIARRRLIQAPAPRPGLEILDVQGTSTAALRKRAGRGLASQRRWILERLGAEPTEPGAWVHGRHSGAKVHLHLSDVPLTARRAAEIAKAARLGRGGTLLCCAWEFEPGFWERIASARGVIPVRLPPEWLQFPADDDAPPMVLPRLRVRVRVPRAGAGRVRIGLLGLAVPALGDLLSGGRPRRPNRTVDAWGVDTAWQPGQPFSPTWFAAKERWQPAPPRVSPPLPIGPSGKILVQAWDALGVSATALVSLC